MKIIKFNAIWCPGCLVMKSRWKKVCNEIPDLDITNYDYDIDTDMVKKYNIGKILPVTIFLNKEDAEKSSEELKNYAKDIHICTPVSKGCKIENE